MAVLQTFLLSAGMLLTGSINTISKKIQFQTKSKGICGTKKFRKPWFQTAVMFLGETMCLLFLAFLLVIKRLRARRVQTSMNTDAEDSAEKGDIPLSPSAADNPAPPVTWQRKLKFVFLFAILACCDLAGTTLAGIGLLWTFGSIYQMFRGSIIIFTGIWSVIFLRRRLEKFRWAGMILVVIGLLLVGVSGFLSSLKTQKGKQGGLFALGCLLIILGQMANSTQFVLEEKFLKDPVLNPSPLLVVGSEGVWGFLLTVGIALPIVGSIPGKDCGRYEHPIDALVMLGHNGFLLTMVFAYWLSIAFYNGLGLTVAKVLTAVHRTLVDACRTLFVWVSLVILYYATNKKYGEPFTKYSPIELVGFVFMILGTLTYNNVIKWPSVWWYMRDPRRLSQLFKKKDPEEAQETEGLVADKH
eukprot:gnl/Trimastix_PCT/971.p1 GENE.gnl/Trimastix_PCT/971~~gnl/Trimastix_PCT/971.p1  ORF type:complete len:414 (-),score=135.60 gnl/Trimastix_PCT/971:112-1353(-)